MKKHTIFWKGFSVVLVVRSIAKLAIFTVICLPSTNPLAAQSSQLYSGAVVLGTDGQYCQQSGTTSAECTTQADVFFSPPNSRFFGGSAFGKAGFGILHSFASALAVCHVSYLPELTNCFAMSSPTIGQAGFSDLITITNASASGSLDFALRISGTNSVECVGPDTDPYKALVCGNSFAQTLLIVEGIQNFVLGNGTTLLNIQVPFNSVGGTAYVPVNFRLDSAVRVLVSNDTDTNARADFSHTAIVTGLTVLDANGQPVSGAVISAASGTDYNSIHDDIQDNIVKIDLKPGSNPNCVNPGSNGSVTVAIFGSGTFDVANINKSSLKFGGASPLRCSIQDALMEGPTGVFTTDGIADLVCQFTTKAVTWPVKGSNCGSVALAGDLNDGSPIEGSDTACLAGEIACKAGTPIPIP